MKRFVTLFVLLMVTFVTACSDDDTNAPANNTQEADGQWHLIQVTGGIAGVNHLFEPGTITWTFNENETIAVVNTNTNAALEDFFETGTYNFSLSYNGEVNPPCENFLTINFMEFGCMEFTEGDMIVTQLVADGYILKFTR